MALNSRSQLNKLRDIGWSLWDPIGLSKTGGWHGSHAADEYDAYLLQAVAKLGRGQSRDAVASYLATVETEHMKLPENGTALRRARATVNALATTFDGLPRKAWPS
jgi:hypothetical protein